jgi:hypothetical protein
MRLYWIGEQEVAKRRSAIAKRKRSLNGFASGVIAAIGLLVLAEVIGRIFG